MEQKILVAFDASKNAMRAVEYIANHFSTQSKVTLFSVMKEAVAAYEMHAPELTSYFASKEPSFLEVEKEKKKWLEEAQQKAKERLLGTGFHEANISLKVVTNKKGIAREIVKEAESGYDIIVLGRRGLSELKEYFLGSISQKVIHSAKDISVLLVT
jgi:nucleotide-binding universal stress UspA family protein